MDAEQKEQEELSKFLNEVDNRISNIGSLPPEELEILLNKTRIILGVGEEETITATILPDDAKNKEITWKSENEEIVTVEDGKITAHTPGTTNIIVTAQNGSGATKKCEVIVGRAVSELEAGDYVKYDTGRIEVGTNGVVVCRVLYTSSSSYGLQMITHDNIRTITIGGGTYEAAHASWQSAITTLNDRAADYINNDYVVDARCVGSYPTVNQEGKMTNKYTTAGDTSNQDYNTLQSLRMQKTGDGYWLSKSSTYNSSSTYAPMVALVDENGTISGGVYICSLVNGKIKTAYNHELGLRPCFSLKSNVKIIGGDGKSSDSAYILGI